MTKRKKIFHLLGSKIHFSLCGISYSKVEHIVSPAMRHILLGRRDARLCHKCKHIHKNNLDTVQ